MEFVSSYRCGVDFLSATALAASIISLTVSSVSSSIHQALSPDFTCVMRYTPFCLPRDTLSSSNDIHHGTDDDSVTVVSSHSDMDASLLIDFMAVPLTVVFSHADVALLESLIFDDLD